LAEETRHMTAFQTMFGHFEWLRLPFGLCNSPAVFQRTMELALSGLQWESCICYIDDIIVFSDTFREHLVRLTEVFLRLGAAGLKLKAKKCKVMRAAVTYLGMRFTEGGFFPDPDKTEPIRSLTLPKDQHELRQLLGLFSYYRRFIENFAKRSSTFYALLKKGAKWEIGEEHTKQLEDLKQALMSPPILRFPDFTKTFRISTDASYEGLGAVLEQEYEGHYHPLVYASRRLKPSESADTSDTAAVHLEAKAAIFGCKMFRHYILGYPTEIVTDAAAVPAMFTDKNPSAKVGRWVMRMQEYRVTFRHRPGAQNQVADALSRKGATKVPKVQVRPQKRPTSPDTRLVLAIEANDNEDEAEKGVTDIMDWTTFMTQPASIDLVGLGASIGMSTERLLMITETPPCHNCEYGGEEHPIKGE
jgi:hypothetical protein